MSDTQQDQQSPAPGQTPVTIHSQYIRDLSFENPNAPESMRGDAPAPALNLNIGMDAREVPNDGSTPNLFEVVLNVRAEAMRDDFVVFIAEILYGVLVSVDPRFPKENHHPLLLIEIPRLAFPFVRQILMDTTIQGGFPPLMLNPVDFQALYMQQFGDEIRKAQQKVKDDLRADVEKETRNKKDKEKKDS